MQEASAAEKKASSKDTGNMQIGDDDEDKPDEEDIEDGGDEGAEDEEVPEEDGEDEGRDDDDGDDEAQDDEGEDFSEEEEEDESEPEDEDDPEGEDGAGNSEQDGNEESEDGSEDDSEDEEEVEMPRLGIFAKFRGPLGWRKRAEAEDLNSSNKFVLKLGVLDPEAEKAAKQESEVFATVEFIESDEDRANGLLRLKLPEGVEFTQKGKWLQATIPYRQQEA